MSTHRTPVPAAPLPALPLAVLGHHDPIDPGALPGWRLLVVYRGRHCPACAKYLARLAELHPRFEALGVTVIAASSDPQARAGEQAQQADWPFLVAHDLGVEQMRALGLFVSAADESADADRPFAEPGLFLLNPSGTLQALDVSNVPFSRPDLAGILEGIEKVQQDQPPIHGTC
jgi:peroxiredoxin